jgi:glycosyltransferase involved in cell wall biosynthesis
VTVDVIIPAWTETLDHLNEAIASLPGGFYPLVVLNGPDAADIHDIAVERSPMVRWAVLPAGEGCYQCRARNWGLSLADRPQVAFLDADDAFLPGIEVVAARASGHRGAYGAMITTWADGSDEERRLAGPPTLVIPHHGSYVLRRDVCPEFDIWAPHQVPWRGTPYGYVFWAAVGDDDIIEVDVDALMYRHKWSDRQASNRYWEAEGFLGEGQPWPSV